MVFRLHIMTVSFQGRHGVWGPCQWSACEIRCGTSTCVPREGGTSRQFALCCNFKLLASQGHPTHSFLSLVMESSMCHAYPRRATAARVLRHRASVDPLRPAAAEHLVWGPPKLRGAHNSSGKRHTNADRLLLKYALSTALQGFGSP